MTYSPELHITTYELAGILGIETARLPCLLCKKGTPRGLGRIRMDGKRQQLYDRAEVMEWIGKQPIPDKIAIKAEPHKVETVAPLDRRAIAALRARATGSEGYRPSPQMRINQERAAEVYPHRLITPDGVGNGQEYAQGNRRFSI